MSLQKMNEKKPLIYCITNYVVANFTANGLLIIGAAQENSFNPLQQVMEVRV